MTFAGGLTPVLTDDFCQYASLYREGMTATAASTASFASTKSLKPSTLDAVERTALQSSPATGSTLYLPRSHPQAKT
jgi:hypothetical protein